MALRRSVGLLGDALAWLAAFAVKVLETTGYPGLFLLMAAESMVFPVPSEAVMPFAGYLAWRGDFTIWGAMLASSLGSMFGSWLSYLMGRHGFLPLVERYGKYVLVGRAHIESAEQWFAKRGAAAIFVCRFIPGVRHVISIPAGAARMRLSRFFVATLLGATLWNAILFGIGYALGDEWERIAEYKNGLDIVAIAIGLLLLGYIVYEWRKGVLRWR